MNPSLSRLLSIVASNEPELASLPSPATVHPHDRLISGLVSKRRRQSELEADALEWSLEFNRDVLSGFSSRASPNSPSHTQPDSSSPSSSSGQFSSKFKSELHSHSRSSDSENPQSGQIVDEEGVRRLSSTSTMMISNSSDPPAPAPAPAPLPRRRRGLMSGSPILSSSSRSRLRSPLPPPVSESEGGAGAERSAATSGSPVPSRSGSRSRSGGLPRSPFIARVSPSLSHGLFGGGERGQRTNEERLRPTKESLEDTEKPTGTGIGASAGAQIGGPGDDTGDGGIVKRPRFETRGYVVQNDSSVRVRVRKNPALFGLGRDMGVRVRVPRRGMGGGRGRGPVGGGIKRIREKEENEPFVAKKIWERRNPASASVPRDSVAGAGARQDKKGVPKRSRQAKEVPHPHPQPAPEPALRVPVARPPPQPRVRPPLPNPQPRVRVQQRTDQEPSEPSPLPHPFREMGPDSVSVPSNDLRHDSHHIPPSISVRSSVDSERRTEIPSPHPLPSEEERKESILLDAVRRAKLRSRERPTHSRGRGGSRGRGRGRRRKGRRGRRARRHQPAPRVARDGSGRGRGRRRPKPRPKVKATRSSRKTPEVTQFDEYAQKLEGLVTNAETQLVAANEHLQRLFTASATTQAEDLCERYVAEFKSKFDRLQRAAKDTLERMGEGSERFATRVSEVEHRMNAQFQEWRSKMSLEKTMRELFPHDHDHDHRQDGPISAKLLDVTLPSWNEESPLEALDFLKEEEQLMFQQIVGEMDVDEIRQEIREIGIESERLSCPLPPAKKIDRISIDEFVPRIGSPGEAESEGGPSLPPQISRERLPAEEIHIRFGPFARALLKHSCMNRPKIPIRIPFEDEKEEGEGGSRPTAEEIPEEPTLPVEVEAGARNVEDSVDKFVADEEPERVPENPESESSRNLFDREISSQSESASSFEVSSDEPPPPIDRVVISAPVRGAGGRPGEEQAKLFQSTITDVVQRLHEKPEDDPITEDPISQPGFVKMGGSAPDEDLCGWPEASESPPSRRVEWNPVTTNVGRYVEEHIKIAAERMVEDSIFRLREEAVSEFLTQTLDKQKEIPAPAPKTIGPPALEPALARFCMENGIGPNDEAFQLMLREAVVDCVRTAADSPPSDRRLPQVTVMEEDIPEPKPASVVADPGRDRKLALLSTLVLARSHLSDEIDELGLEDEEEGEEIDAPVSLLREFGISTQEQPPNVFSAQVQTDSDIVMDRDMQTVGKILIERDVQADSRMANCGVQAEGAPRFERDMQTAEVPLASVNLQTETEVLFPEDEDALVLENVFQRLEVGERDIERRFAEALRRSQGVGTEFMSSTDESADDPFQDVKIGDIHGVIGDLWSDEIRHIDEESEDEVVIDVDVDGQVDKVPGEVRLPRPVSRPRDVSHMFPSRIDAEEPLSEMTDDSLLQMSSDMDSQSEDLESWRENLNSRFPFPSLSDKPSVEDLFSDDENESQAGVDGGLSKSPEDVVTMLMQSSLAVLSGEDEFGET